jgi:hypothetical protein
MADVALVTVPDEGAAETVRAALAEVDIPVRLERARPENPYRVQVLAGAWRILVPEERLAEAQLSLQRLEKEMAEEVDAQAAGWEPEGAAAAATPEVPRRPGPKISFALALGALLPFPVSCFYVRARWRGAIWLGLVVAAFVLAMAGDGGYRLLPFGEDSPLAYGDRLLLVCLFAKLADLFVALLLIAFRRRWPSPA